jgi:hypothetical protein
MDKTRGHYIESDTERQIPHILPHMWILKGSECGIVVTRIWDRRSVEGS